MPLTAIDAARRRDDAIEQVVNHADELDPCWSDRAYSALELYCKKVAEPFIIEDVRAWAEGLWLISPPHDSRAWGAVIRRAAANGTVRKVGYAPAKSSNLSPKVQWQAA